MCLTLANLDKFFRWDRKEESSKVKEEKKETNGDASVKEKSGGKSPKPESSPKPEVTVKVEKEEPPPKKERWDRDRSDRGDVRHSRDRKSRRSDRWVGHIFRLISLL